MANVKVPVDLCNVRMVSEELSDRNNDGQSSDCTFLSESHQSVASTPFQPSADALNFSSSFPALEWELFTPEVRLTRAPPLCWLSGRV